MNLSHFGTQWRGASAASTPRTCAASWTKAASVRLDAGFQATVDGKVYGQPLYWIPPAGGGAARIMPLQGRVGAAVKVREIFIYPAHVERLLREVRGLPQASCAVTRAGNRDEITCVIALAPGADAAAIESELREAFLAITRLRLDHIRHATPEEIGDQRLVDRR